MGLKKVDIINEEWDTIIVLDACRFDMFKDIAHPILGDKLEKRWSTGCNTAQWARSQFNEGFENVVYLDSSTHITKLRGSKFKHIEPIWKDGWDDELGTVPPWTVIDRYKKFRNEKKLIIHFFQPHQPFLDGNKRIFRKPKPGKKYDNEWQRIYTGELSLEEVIDAYHINLRTVIPYVKEILDDRDGISIVTADHGNLYEFPYWHMPGEMKPEQWNDIGLRLVPWLIIKK